MSNPLPAPKCKCWIEAGTGRTVPTVDCPVHYDPMVHRNGPPEPLITDPVGKETGASLNSPLPAPRYSRSEFERDQMGETGDRLSPPLPASEPPTLVPVHCAGCGLRWTSPEGFIWAGVVHLCGDCWRKVQGVLHAPPVEPHTTREPDLERIASEHFYDVMTAEDQNLGCEVARRERPESHVLFCCQWNRRVGVAMCGECEALERRIKRYAAECARSALTDLQTALDASESSRRSLVGELAMKDEELSWLNDWKPAAEVHMRRAEHAESKLAELDDMARAWAEPRGAYTANAKGVLMSLGKLSNDNELQGEQIETLTKALDGLAAAAADLVGYCDNCGGTGFIGGGNELPCAWCTPTRQALASIRPQEPTP